MNADTIPLLDVFSELRRRNLMLGLPEYLAALRALEAGFGTGSRRELTWMCQALWAKSPEEQQQVAEALTMFLPPPVTDQELEALAEEARQKAGPAGAPAGGKPPGGQAPGRGAKPAAGPRFVGLGTAAGAAAPVVSRPGPGWARVDASQFNLAGELPVTRRAMKRAWRYVRRMRREGPATELDVAATAERLCRDGVLVAPVLVPPRRNLAAVVVLVDEGGSMAPFRQLTEALLDSLRHSGFARAGVFFFHDVPADVVFREADLWDAVPLAEALRPFAAGAVLVVSDAGAARGNRDDQRAKRTCQAVAALRRVTPRLAWLNPVPRPRWPATTAEMIRQECAVPMFALERRAELDAAMDVLRGRAVS